MAGITATVLVLAGAAIAAAAVSRPSVEKARRREFAASTASSVAPVPVPSATSAPARVDPTDSDRVLLDPPTTPPAANAPLERPSTRAKTAAPLKDGEDPIPVLEAIRALRYHGDPASAGVLLAQYLRAHPHSVLSEDAYALSIEAAIARRDPRAAELTRRYLAQFPNGRYRAFALQMAQSTTPQVTR
jgi:hypothetical protein